MNKKVYLTAMEVEMELEEARKKIGFVPGVEKTAIKTMVETAKQNGKFGDKLLLVTSPVYIHVPTWQRKLSIPRAQAIGNSYNKYKWEVPKLLYHDGKLSCIDGMHRLYGAFLGGVENVTLEIITDLTEAEAIDIFLEQSSDRKKMSPSDIYGAAIEAGKPEYIRLRDICKKNNVRIKGDKTVSNPVGIFTSISDGISLTRNNPELLDKILKLIGKLQWNGGNIYEGKAYSAKVIRVLRRLYAYHEGEEKLLEGILLSSCKGAEYFKVNLSEKWQDGLFDFLSEIIEDNMNVKIFADTQKKRSKRAKA